MASESSSSYTSPIVSILRQICSVRGISYTSFSIHCNISIYIQIFQVLYLRVPHRNLWCISTPPPLVVFPLHSLFIHSDAPLPLPLSYWLKLFSSQTFSPINTPITSSRLFFQLAQPMILGPAECSETSVYKIQTSGNYPK